MTTALPVLWRSRRPETLLGISGATSREGRLHYPCERTSERGVLRRYGRAVRTAGAARYKMEAFGIFEGGGAKGLAHVGAVAEVQELGVQFVGVAGASAGSIIAALIAVGYKPKELYDPVTKTGLLAGPLTDMFGPGAWAEWKLFSGAVESKLDAFSPLGAWLTAYPFYRKWREPLTRMMTHFGFFETHPIEATLDRWLRGGSVQIPVEKERLLFGDLDPAIVPPLRIIASDINAHTPVVFSREKTPDISVARAVVASSAIPFFFRPVQIEVDGEIRTLVDGGLVSNFPVWIFDDVRRRRIKSAPIIGFRLSQKGGVNRETKTPLLRFSQSLLETALNANIELHARGIDDLFTFPIEVNVSTYDFDLSSDSKHELYVSARQQAGYKLLRNLAPRDPEVLSEMLRVAIDLFRTEAGQVPLRANLVLPTNRETLRIVASHNMDGDADDQLEFQFHEGACGECWRGRRIVISDVGAFLKEKKPIPGLTKHQQAQVRPTLSTIISIPIFNPSGRALDPGSTDNSLIGILNIDSDTATVGDFERCTRAAERAAITCGRVLSARLSA